MACPEIRFETWKSSPPPGESAAQPTAHEKLSHGRGAAHLAHRPSPSGGGTEAGEAGASMRVSSRPYRNPQQVSKVNSL